MQCRERLDGQHAKCCNCEKCVYQWKQWPMSLDVVSASVAGRSLGNGDEISESLLPSSIRSIRCCKPFEENQ